MSERQPSRKLQEANKNSMNLPAYMSNIHNNRQRNKEEETVKLNRPAVITGRTQNEELQMKKQSLIFGHKNSGKD